MVSWLEIFAKYDGSICCVDRIVPEAIHDQVATELLVSGLLTWHICFICEPVLNIIICFVFISF